MISFSKAFISTILFIGGSFFIPKLAGAGDSNVRAPFNAGEIIERVSHHPRVEGDRIVIQDRAYEAEFKEGKAVIKAREGKPGAEDVVIPVSGRPEVRDGKVVYSSWDGEVEFEGGSRGLRFRERGSTPYSDSLVERYTGNAARIQRNYSNLPKQALMESRWIPSGEFLLDTSVVYLPAVHDQVYPSVASDGTNYLVVWTQGPPTVIYGARVTSSGVVMDLAGIPIGAPKPFPWYHYQWYPSVAFGGSNYLVVWQDMRNGIKYDIYGARVTTGGVVLDTAGITISTFVTAYDNRYPAVAFDGTNYLAVWKGGRISGDGNNIYGARVSQGGVVLDPSGIDISTAPNEQDLPCVAFMGSNYLVAWRDTRNGGANDIYGARVTPGGVVLDPAGIAISVAMEDQAWPSIATDDTNCLVVWQDTRNASYHDIYGARVSPSGVVLDTAGIAISTVSRHKQFPAVAFDGVNYLVIWADSLNGNSAIYGSRVTTGGVVLDSTGIAISTGSGDRTFPSLAFDGTDYLIGWADGQNPSAYDIYGARVTPGGTVLDTAGIAISTEANHQELPSVAFDGTNYLAVWQEWHSKCSYDIYGARISSSGTVLDPAGVAICTTAYDQRSPSVAFDGTNYLVVWQDKRSGSRYDIYGARVSLGGVVLDPVGLGISISTANKGNPSIAFDGANYLVVWSDGHIYGTRVTPGGVVLDTAGIAIRITPTSQALPTIAFDGTNYLVAWEDYIYHPRWPSHNIDGARVTPGGVVLDTTAFVISRPISGATAPFVAFGGTNYLVVWQLWQTDFDIYGSRVTPGGVVLDPSGIPIARALNGQSLPSVAFDGTEYIVVWEDNRSGAAWDIYGAKLNPSGAVIDSFPVSLQPGDQLGPAIARGNGSQLLITYSCYTDSINGRPVINQRIWGKFYPMSGVNQEEGFGSINPGLSLRVYPNPFREKAWVSANVPGRLKVYDALGRLVREFPKEAAKPGPLAWDGRDERGRRLPGGVYFLRFEHGAGCETRKIILIR